MSKIHHNTVYRKPYRVAVLNNIEATTLYNVFIGNPKLLPIIILINDYFNDIYKNMLLIIYYPCVYNIYIIYIYNHLFHLLAI